MSRGGRGDIGSAYLLHPRVPRLSPLTALCHKRTKYALTALCHKRKEYAFAVASYHVKIVDSHTNQCYRVYLSFTERFGVIVFVVVFMVRFCLTCE